MEKLETSWSKTKTNKELLWSLVTVCRLPPLSSQLPHTGLWHFKCLMFGSVWFFLQLFWTGTASISMSAAVAVVGSTAAHLVPPAAAPFPSMYSALSSASCCRTFLRVSCCCCSLNKMQALIPARLRMLQKTVAIFGYRLYSGTEYGLLQDAHPTSRYYSTSQTLVLPSPR